jgi:hypothetical protein
MDMRDWLTAYTNGLAMHDRRKEQEENLSLQRNDQGIREMAMAQAAQQHADTLALSKDAHAIERERLARSAKHDEDARQLTIAQMLGAGEVRQPLPFTPGMPTMPTVQPGSKEPIMLDPMPGYTQGEKGLDILGGLVPTKPEERAETLFNKNAELEQRKYQANLQQIQQQANYFFKDDPDRRDLYST